MKTSINLSIICLFLLASCGKDTCHTFSGRILSYGTKEPVADAVVKIIAGKAVGLFEPVVEWVTDSVRTGSDGRWEITVTEGDYHKIGPIIKEGFFSDLSFEPRAQLYSLSESGPLSNKDYIIDPKGILHVIVEDDPNVSGDYIRFGGSFTGSSIVNQHNKMYEVRAERFHNIYYKTEEIPTNFTIDSIYVKSGIETLLKVNY